MSQPDSTEPSLSGEALFRIDQICDAFEEDWSRGQPPSLETYLESVPPHECPTLLRYLLSVELEYRSRRGDEPSEQEYRDRFPEFSTVVVSVFVQVQTRERTIELTQGECEDRLEGATLVRDHVGHEETPQPLTLKGYEVLTEIARGGMGAVYRVFESKFRRPLALKILLPGSSSPHLVGRFHNEASLTAQLQHPGIPPVHDRGTLANGLPFFAMKLIEGETFRSLLKNRSAPSDNLPHFLSVFEQICQTLAYAHDRGVIHRDLKPANIMVGAFGDVQVMDWGLAKKLSDPEEIGETATADSSSGETWNSHNASVGSRTGNILGTPAYMPPEQARGEIRDLDARADVFGLGALLCEILTGAPPFRGGGPESLALKAGQGDLRDAFKRLDECGADLKLIELAKKCLAPNREDRLNNGAEVAEAIERYQRQVQARLREAEIQAASATAKAAAERGRRRVVMILGLVGALFLSGIVGAGVWYRFDRLRLDAEAKTREIREQGKLNRLAGGIRQALDEAKRVQDRLRADLKNKGGVRRMANNPEGWKATIQMADSALKRTEALLGRAGGKLDPRFREDLQQLKAKVEEDKKDRKTVLALNKIRDERFNSFQTKFDRVRICQKYLAEFQRAGFDVLNEDTKTLIGKIRQSVIREQFVASLDQWAESAANNKDFRRLVRLAKEVDTNHLRNKLRTALLAGSRKQFEQVAQKYLEDQSELKELSPQTLFLIAQAFPNKQQQEKWFRKAVMVAPDDFALLFRFGTFLYKLRKTGESEGYFGRALALQPNNPQVWNGLGGALEKQKKLAEAVVACTKALELEPELAWAWNNLGNVYLSQQKLDAAAVALKKALEIDPKSAPTWSNLGILLRAQKKLEEAAKAYETALKIDPELHVAWANLSNVFVDKKQFKEAIAACNKALECDPNSPRTWVILGNVHLAKKELEKAESAYRKALKLDSNLAEGWNSLGVLQCDHLGQYEQAEKHFRHAVGLYPEFAAAWVHLGIALRKQDRLDPAIEVFRRGAKIAPHYTPAWQNLGEALMQQRKFPQAMTALQQARKTDPKSADPLVNLGAIYGMQRKWDKAVDALTKAVAINPQSKQGWMNLGTVQMAQRKFSEAAVAFDKAAKIDPQFSAAFLRLGFALKAQRKYKDAATALQKGLKINPNLPQVWAGLAYLQFEKLRQYKLAEESFRKALQFNPQFALAWNNLGRALSRQKKFEKAAEAYKKALKIDPSMADAWNGLGVLQLNTFKQYTKAEKNFRKALQLNPQYVLAWSNLGAALRNQKQLDEAITAFGKALKLNPRMPLAHAGLGLALLNAGRFEEARKSYSQALALFPKAHPYYGFTQKRIRFCTDALSWEKKLPDVLAGKKRISEREYLFLIQLCATYKKQYCDAAHLCRDLFEKNPKPAQEIESRDRFFAACWAILGTSSMDAHAKKITAKERTELRQQAVTWLKADLKNYREHLEKERLFAADVVDRMESWQTTPKLATVRDKEALAKLSKDEQETWKKLWAQVRALVKSARSHFMETELKGELKGPSVTHAHKMQVDHTYVIVMKSTQFDPTLQLLDVNGKKLAENDDLAKKNRNSRIIFTPKQDGSYRIIATSFEQRGRGTFTILIRELPSK